VIERTSLLESVPRGTLFVLPGQPGVYFDLPMNEEAASGFLQELSKKRRGTFTSDSAESVIQTLVDNHGLVVVHKEDTENLNTDEVSVDPEHCRFRLSTGGLLDLDNVKAYVENGRIKPDTGLYIVGLSGSVRGPIKSSDISCVRDLFKDYEDEPKVPSYTIVASSTPVTAGCFAQIIDQFGIRDTDSVALTKWYGDNSTEKVAKAGGLHA
jgi:hypothetical protein